MNKLTDDLDDLSKWKNELLFLAEKRSSLLLQSAKSYLPIFFSNLDKIQPNLMRSEKTFCIYLKLNYSTKEISEILHVTPKAIEIRKNRIRKKFNISSDTDLYVWFEKI